MWFAFGVCYAVLCWLMKGFTARFSAFYLLLCTIGITEVSRNSHISVLSKEYILCSSVFNTTDFYLVACDLYIFLDIFDYFRLQKRRTVECFWFINFAVGSF